MAKARTEEELWKALDELGQDMLDPTMPVPAVDAEIRRAGGDPKTIEAEGIAIVARLQDEQRLAWQKAARRRQQEFVDGVASRGRVVSLPRAEVLLRLNTLRNDPRLGAPIVTAFRKRRPEESTDDELRDLLEDVEALRSLEADQDDSE